MKCVEVYKELYHQEPFDVAFCPYRISPLGAHIDHVDVMTAAFKEYTGVSLKREQRQSIRKKLEQAKERVAKHREITKEKMKDRGQVR